MLMLLNNHMRFIACAAIALSIITWATDITGVVYECPYCRTQRTVIGLLGLLMLFPRPFHWTIKYLAAVVGAFGFSVGSTQHFSGWRKIMGNEFEWGEQWFLNSWMLSGFALFIISGLVLLIFSTTQPKK